MSVAAEFAGVDHAPYLLELLPLVLVYDGRISAPTWASG